MLSHKLGSEEMFYADIHCKDGCVRLIAALSPDGWMAGILHPDTREWTPQGVWPDAKGAQQQAEFCARQTLSFVDPVIWVHGPPSDL
jgi:hypothetical protein